MPIRITNRTQCSIADCIETAAGGVTQGTGEDAFSKCGCANALAGLTGPNTAGGAGTDPANIARLFAVSASVIGLAATASLAGNVSECDPAFANARAKELTKDARMKLQRGDIIEADTLFRQAAELYYGAENYESWYNVMVETGTALKERISSLTATPIYREIWERSLDIVYTRLGDQAQGPVFWERAHENYFKEVKAYVKEELFCKAMEVVIARAERVRFVGSNEQRNTVSNFAKSIIEGLYSTKIRPTQDVLDALTMAVRYIYHKKFEGHSAFVKSLKEWQALREFVRRYPSLQPTDRTLRALSADIASRGSDERPQPIPIANDVQEIVDTLRERETGRGPARPGRPVRPAAAGHERGLDGVDGKGRGRDREDSDGRDREGQGRTRRGLK